jgi:hypothetical protein
LGLGIRWCLGIRGRRRRKGRGSSWPLTNRSRWRDGRSVGTEGGRGQMRILGLLGVWGRRETTWRRRRCSSVIVEVAATLTAATASMSAITTTPSASVSAAPQVSTPAPERAALMRPSAGQTEPSFRFRRQERQRRLALPEAGRPGQRLVGAVLILIIAEHAVHLAGRRRKDVTRQIRL